MGECKHPCRWEYALVEKKRPGKYLPIIEDDRGSYILSSRDLNMIEHLDEMAKAGITSIKIEGCMKSAYYAATVVNAYRRAVDGASPIDVLKSELDNISHREYCTGFYFGPIELGGSGEYIQSCDFVGVVKSIDE